MPDNNNKIRVRGEGIKNYNLNNQPDVQKFNNQAVYTKGFTQGLQSGSSNLFNLQLGGKPRRLFGIILSVPNANQNDDDIISLTINSEIIIDKVIWKAYSPSNVHNAFKTEQYFEIPRGLSGSDTVEMAVNAVNAHNLFIVFYLANSW